MMNDLFESITGNPERRATHAVAIIRHAVESIGISDLAFGRMMLRSFNNAILIELKGGVSKPDGCGGDIMEVAKQELETLKEYVKKFEEAIDKADAKIESGGKEKDEEDGEEN